MIEQPCSVCGQMNDPKLMHGISQTPDGITFYCKRKECVEAFFADAKKLPRQRPPRSAGK